MKKTLGVGIAVAAAVALSACEMHTEVTVGSDGTGTYSVNQEWPKDEMAEAMELPESEVYDEFVATMEQEDEFGLSPDDTSAEYVDNGDTIGIYGSTEFAYNMGGWEFPDDAQPPAETSFEVDETGEMATITYDMAGGDTAELADLEQIEGWDLTVAFTFPGEVVSSTGGGSISGSTITWGTDEIVGSLTSGEALSATGSLGGASVPPAPSGGQGSDDPADSTEPEVIETPSPQPEPEVTESPEPEATQTAEPADENDEEEDRRRDEEDRPAADEGGFDIPWRVILMTGLGIVGLAGITIAIIFLIRGKSSGNSVE